MNSESRKNDKRSEFVVRNSLLTDLFENVHIRTVYHLFIAIFVGLFINTLAYDYLKKGQVTLGLNTIRNAFANIHIVFLIWGGYFGATCLVYQFFSIWNKNRNFTQKQVTKCWDWFWGILLVSYYITSFKVAEYLVARFNLYAASAAIVNLEQTRLLMKIHSFVRNTGSNPLPPFSRFLYFLFAPTLIYQDSYPRSDRIRWSFVFFRFLECVAVLFFFTFVFEKFLIPSVQDFGLRKYTINDIILCILENTITGILFLLPTFFLIMHSWPNMFAELLRFGDRLFYTDWWTCMSTYTKNSGYLYRWNIVVQQWLYRYIYKDFYEYVFYRNSTLSKMAVIVISGIVHEWILTNTLGFFFPLMFVMFLTLGSVLVFLKSANAPVYNVLFWYFLGLTTGSLVVLYGIESFARINAPDKNPSSSFMPRFLSCDCIDF